MTVLDQLGSTFSDFSWSSIGSIAFILAIFFGVLLLFGGIAFFMWWRSYHIKVRIYEPFGQVPEDILKGINDNELEDTTKKVRFDMLRYKTTHGKYATIRGTNYFATFMPFKRHEPIDMKYLYDDGVHLVKLSKDVFIPIPKPKLIVNVGENVSINIADNNKWIAWNNLMSDRINNKYVDQEAQKRMVWWFVIGIAAMVIIGGFLLYLIYSSVNRGYEAADKIAQFADSLSGKSANAPI